MVRNTETKDWAILSKKENAVLFSEIDVLLRALDRFFNIENHTSSKEDLTSRNFFEETIAVRDTILQMLGLLEVVIPENRKNAYWFQKFAESKFLSQSRRDRFRMEIFKQDSPEKGLYLLFDSFVNLKGILTDLLRTRNISYMGFSNIGNMISKEIRENLFFNPFRYNVNPELDVIGNAEISQIVKTIQDPKLKKEISLIYLYLFRFLRFLSFIDVSSRRTSSLHSSLLILILMKTEIGIFRSFLDEILKKGIPDEMEMIFKPIAYSFSMEGRRVFQQELKDIYRKKTSVQYRGKLENSHGILKNLTEQSIVQLSQFFNPDIKGERIFDSFVTKLEQSLRLREDIFVLHKFFCVLGSRSEDAEDRLNVFRSIKNFLMYFESFTFRLLRHDDYEEFSQFFNALNSASDEIIRGPGFQKVSEKIQHFKIFLETTLRHINNRSEISEIPLDADRIDSLIDQYIH